MLPREVAAKIRQLQIRARRAVEDLLGGEYHSVFKGMGVAFDEVRAYQPGDDVRLIDWNVTARMGNPFIKRFIEERELTVMLLIDASASSQFGTQRFEKNEIIAELAALLAFSAISNNDKVGLLTFTDRVERFVPPRKGPRHVLRLIREVLFFQPEHRGTSIKTALDHVNRILHHRAIVFLLSDFLDTGFEGALKQTGRRHDLIAIRVHDRREEELPNVGLVRIEDAESGKQILIDTGSRQVRERYAALARERREGLRRTVRGARVDLIETGTDGAHLDQLVRFFKVREKRIRHGA